MEVLKTDLQKERRQRDYVIYSEYEKMMSVQGQSATEVCKYLMKKHSIHSISTIYVIRKRVENELKKEGKL